MFVITSLLLHFVLPDISDLLCVCQPVFLTKKTFNDPAIGVDWGEVTEKLLSQKDMTAPLLSDSDCNFIYGEI